GGSGEELGASIAVDTAGNAYVTGQTSSADFPTKNAFQPTFGGGGLDAFVTKLNANGDMLLYSTYLGGSGNPDPVATLNDEGWGIAVDTAGNAYVTGFTGSTDFPTQNAFQPDYGGGFNDAFVTKLNAAGDTLLYSTYLGGSNGDSGLGIAVDTAGNAYVTGLTGKGFPLKDPFQFCFGGGDRDIFVAKLDPSQSGAASLVYSSYLGGIGTDYGFGIAVDTAGNAYVTGQTSSTDFPTTPGAFDHTFNGGFADAFVAKISPLSGKAGSPVAHGCGPFVGGIVPSPEPRLSVSRVELDFGLLRLGGKITKRNQSLQLMNIGDAPLTGNVGTLSDPFMVVSGGGSFTLAPAQRETVTVQFAPSGAGDFSDTLEITSNDPRRSMVDVDVEGSGFEVD
ncbi:MAG: SBBP repeat-containing protein, partial [Deltaproteobacteria bacterium]|nr:SBBP repeat-containing protein [Deltaproteobacteria bacterium]